MLKMADTHLRCHPFPLDLSEARIKTLLETITSEWLFFLKFLIYCVKQFAQLSTNNA